MILATHAISGAVLAELVPNHKVEAFALGFVSHFILDSIPHWDYNLNSKEKDSKDPLVSDMLLGKEFFRDLLKISLDALIGVAWGLGIAHFIFQNISWGIFFGIVGGLMPDFLQFVYMKWRHEPLVSLQRFHKWIHAKKEITNFVYGIFAQILIIFVLSLSVKFLVRIF